MANKILHTMVFGTLEWDPEDGLWEYYTIELDGAETETRLEIEAELEEDTVILKFLENMGSMVAKAKATALANYPKEETIQTFVDWQMEELEEESLLSCLAVDTMKAATPEKFLEALKLRGISINTDLECSIDLCLDPELTDELLVVRFDQDLNIFEIAHES